MQRQILVPLDGSRLAESALPHALTLARATGNGLTLLRVVPVPPAANPLAWAVPGHSTTWAYHKEMLDMAREYLESIVGRLEREGVAALTKLVEGDPAENIIRHAQDNLDIVMIVMATHGRSGLSRWVLGSIAEKVLQTSPTPLVLVRPPEDEAETWVPAPQMPGYSTILVPLDGSTLAEQALKQTRMLAIATGATLLLVSVVSGPEDLSIARRAESMRVLAVMHEQEKQRLDSYLASTAQQIEAAGIKVRTLLSEGDAADEILRASLEKDADLILMSTHGLGGLERLWMGSVAIRVAHAADLPVLLVRANVEARGQQLARAETDSGEWSMVGNRQLRGESMAQHGRRAT